jgi:hypothetical protein
MSFTSNGLPAVEPSDAMTRAGPRNAVLDRFLFCYHNIHVDA